MKQIKVIMVGLGNVGQGFLKILETDHASLMQNQGLDIKVVGVSDLRYGNYSEPNGFQVTSLLKALENGNLEGMGKKDERSSTENWIKSCDAQFLLEASFTNFTNAEPAIQYMRAALSSGKHVVTSNKGPIALFYSELATMAKQGGLQIGVEGTVMSGTPSMALGINTLKAAGITSIQGILNGTTNFILTRMEQGNSYQNALAEAQKLGYAEADPTGDVEGYDAAGKVVILGNLVMDRPITFADVERKGISGVTLQDVELAKAEGKRWKLIGTLSIDNGIVNASVKPTLLPTEDPLANVGGATNAITFTTQHMGKVTLIGAGAGRVETGFALLSDILAISKTNEPSNWRKQ